MKRAQILNLAALTLLAFSAAFASAQEDEDYVVPAASRNPFGNALASLQARLSNGRRDYRDENADDDEGCTGIVDAVFCREDEEGRLSHMAYHNSLTGLQLLGCGRSKDWTKSEATQILVLAQGEVITEVKTCPGSSRTGISVTFLTDAGQAMTCGSAHTRRASYTTGPGVDRQQPRNTSFTTDEEEDRAGGAEGEVYEGYAEGRRSSRRSSRRSYNSSPRQLLAAESDNAASPAAKRCHACTAKQQPPWSGVPECYGSGVEAYCTYKNSRYYKNYNMYLAQLEAYNAAGPNSSPYRPRFYYSVVNPLAAFDTDCSSKGLVKRVTDVCFNEDFKPQESLPVVPTVIVIDMDELSDGEVRPCPSTPAEINKVQTELEQVLSGLVQLSGGVLGGYSVTVIAENCVEGFQNGRTLLQATSNSSFTVTATISAGAGYTASDVSTWLRTNMPTGDACDVNNLCAGTDFNSVTLFETTPPTARATAAVEVEGRQAQPARQLLLAPRRFKGPEGGAVRVLPAGRQEVVGAPSAS